MFGNLLQLLFPYECPGCGRRVESEFLCSECRRTLVRAKETTIMAVSATGIMQAMALWKFEENKPVQRVLHQLKYANTPWLGLSIGVLLAEALLESSSSSADLIVPVPLHAARQLERGYNQSEWIARGVSRRLDIPMVPKALVRRRSTVSQTALSREQRWQNTDGAFAVGSRRVSGRHVILVDDTLTTGATLMSCAHALIHGGATSVHPVAAAAAPLRIAMEQAVSDTVISDSSLY